MPYSKRIGVLWNKQTKDGSPFLAGLLDLGIIHGEIAISIWPNTDPQRSNRAPDYIISTMPQREEQPPSQTQQPRGIPLPPT
jgi:hypothetical protein